MSQTSLRRARDGEGYLVELSDDGRFNVAQGKGKTERAACNEAEIAWIVTYGRDESRKPTHKTVIVGKVGAR